MLRNDILTNGGANVPSVKSRCLWLYALAGAALALLCDFTLAVTGPPSGNTVIPLILMANAITTLSIIITRRRGQLPAQYNPVSTIYTGAMFLGAAAGDLIASALHSHVGTTNPNTAPFGILLYFGGLFGILFVVFGLTHLPIRH